MEFYSCAIQDVYITGNPVLMYEWTRKPKGSPDENGRQTYICTYMDPMAPIKYEYIYEPKK
jgi:hypothetical protein